MKFLNYKNNKFFVDNLSIKKISKKFQTPFYCYSLSQIKFNLDNFKKSFSQINPLICFSVKSNSNIKILNELKKIGCGADVVSIGELKAALKARIDPSKIVFSGIGKTEEELSFAINKNILLINIESENEAYLINKISKKKSKITSVGIRLNPNVKTNTDKKISTGSKEDKFGLTEKNLLNLIKKIKNLKNLSLDCISVHIGSQILKLHPFNKTLNILDKVIRKSKYKFKFVDLGGGIGIPYNGKNKELNLKNYSKFVKKFIDKFNCKIIFEPGRFIIGNAAVLVTKITYIKKSIEKNFIIIDAGMNDFIRPALYNAKHLILPAEKNYKIIKKNTEFVGPICESTDIFLNTRSFQKIKEKDILLIKDVGAYGMSLASNYNLRPKPAEILVNKSDIKLIRKKENINRLI